MTPAVIRVLGFLALVHGIGLRLDSAWQGTAVLLILGGGAAVVWALASEASVSGPPEG